MVSYAAQLLGQGGRPGTGHDDLAELQRVGAEREVVRHAARPERDLGGRRLVAQAPRYERDRLPQGPDARYDDGVAAVVLGQGSKPQARNRDLDLPERLPGIARHLASDGHRLLRGEQTRQREQRADNDGYEPTACVSHVPSDALCVTRMNRRRPVSRRGTPQRTPLTALRMSSRSYTRCPTA